MRYLICGSRDWLWPETIQEFVETLNLDDVVITGGARGADAHAEHFARERGIEVIVEKAEWAKFGKSAGPIRNRRMVLKHRPDKIVAFQRGNSPGTAHMVNTGKAMKLHTVVYHEPDFVRPMSLRQQLLKFRPPDKS